MRFIRKNGHVIPIHDKTEKSGGYATTAAIGAASGALVHGAANYARVFKAPKAAFAATVAGFGLGVVNGTRIAGKAQEAPKGEKLREFLRHYAAGMIGTSVGGAAGALALKPMVRSTYKAKEGVQSAYKFIKPHTAAFAERRKFKNAKHVFSTVESARKLLK